MIANKKTTDASTIDGMDNARFRLGWHCSTVLLLSLALSLAFLPLQSLRWTASAVVLAGRGSSY